MKLTARDAACGGVLHAASKGFIRGHSCKIRHVYKLRRLRLQPTRRWPIVSKPVKQANSCTVVKPDSPYQIY